LQIVSRAEAQIMDTSPQQKIILRQGKLVVFTRAASPFFQCRIKLPEKPYVYKSLQTTDEAEARQMAEDLYAEAKFELLPIGWTDSVSV
jgi:hypothetical protein